MGIYVSHECLAGRGLHSHVALRSYVSLIREVERGETRYAVLDRQSRCHGEIWASRSRSAHVFGETANVRSIEVSRRLGPLPGTQLPTSMRLGFRGHDYERVLQRDQPRNPAFPRADLYATARGPLRALTRLGKGSCDLDTTTDATTATRSWSMNCAWSSGNKSNTEGVVHFHGDTLDGTTTSRHSFPNLPTKEYTFSIKGRYVGPCDPK
jgi:hypothetical protein